MHTDWFGCSKIIDEWRERLRAVAMIYRFRQARKCQFKLESNLYLAACPGFGTRNFVGSLSIVTGDWHIEPPESV